MSRGRNDRREIAEGQSRWTKDKVCRGRLRVDAILTSEGGRTRGLEDGGADGGADGVDEHFGMGMSGESK